MSADGTSLKAAMFAPFRVKVWQSLTPAQQPMAALSDWRLTLLIIGCRDRVATRRAQNGRKI
jgi:hypothetical protein